MLRRAFSSAVVISLAAVGVALATPGCNIETFECTEGATCEVGETGQNLCSDYCAHRVDCGQLEADDEASCRADCRAARASDEEETDAACECAIEAECGEVKECNPVPTTSSASGGDDDDDDDDDGSDGSHAGGNGAGGDAATTSSSGAGGDDSCGSKLCFGDEECVDGRCVVSCTASCQCPEGEICEGGACAEPPEPTPEPAECDVDCDCPSGSQCIDGACMP